MSKDIFSIYQVKEGLEARDFRFEPLDRLKAAGLAVKCENYKHVYTGKLHPGEEPAIETLEALYTKFNIAHPEDFTGRSLSLSDVVVLRCDGKAAAYYVDSFGFQEVPEFLEGPYRYYSTQRPVDIGTFPKFGNEPIQIENYDSRKLVEGGAFRAWGVLTYTTPLTQKQMDDYELRAAPGNPDQMRLAPEQLEQQVQIVGKWEQAKHIPDVKRLTWFYSDFGSFVKNEFVTDEQLSERYEKVMESKTRSAQKKAEKKPIAERLKEGAEQAAKDNAARPAPTKDTEKDR
jgi:hypothetical protein